MDGLSGRRGRHRSQDHCSIARSRFASASVASEDCVFPHITDEPEALPRDRSEQVLLLAAVADCLADRVDMTGQGRFGNDPAAPHRIQQAILADHAVAVLHEIEKQIEDLRPNRNRFVPARQLSLLGVEHAVSE